MINSKILKISELFLIMLSFSFMIVLDSFAKEGVAEKSSPLVV
jgi:hypothetical protein